MNLIQTCKSVKFWHYLIFSLRFTKGCRSRDSGAAEEDVSSHEKKVFFVPFFLETFDLLLSEHNSMFAESFDLLLSEHKFKSSLPREEGACWEFIFESETNPGGSWQCIASTLFFFRFRFRKSIFPKCLFSKLYFLMDLYLRAKPNQGGAGSELHFRLKAKFAFLGGF